MNATTGLDDSVSRALRKGEESDDTECVIRGQNLGNCGWHLCDR